jgi:hypothetical protein
MLRFVITKIVLLDVQKNKTMKLYLLTGIAKIIPRWQGQTIVHL